MQIHGPRYAEHTFACPACGASVVSEIQPECPVDGELMQQAEKGT